MNIIFSEFNIVPGSRRLIVVDGNNVGHAHTGHVKFSLRGVTICVEYFQKMGHEVNICKNVVDLTCDSMSVCLCVCLYPNSSDGAEM